MFCRRHSVPQYGDKLDREGAVLELRFVFQFFVQTLPLRCSVCAWLQFVMNPIDETRPMMDVSFFPPTCYSRSSSFWLRRRSATLQNPGRRDSARIETSRTRRGWIQPLPSHHVSGDLRNSLFHGPTWTVSAESIVEFACTGLSQSYSNRALDPFLAELPPGAVENLGITILWPSTHRTARSSGSHAADEVPLGEGC